MSSRPGIPPVTLLLLLSTGALAATTAYYARALRVEQARAEHLVDLAAKPVEAAPPPESATASPSVMAPAPAPQADAGTRDRQPVDAPRAPDAGSMAIARDRLERMADPRNRAEHARQQAGEMRTALAEIAPQVGLSPAELDDLVDRMSPLIAEGDQRLLECKADPACDARALQDSLAKGLEAQLAALLGPERQARLETYMASMSERFYVDRLREQLPAAAAITDKQAGDLAMALYEEKKRFEREAAQAGEKLEQFSSTALFGITLPSAAKAGSKDESAQRLASATRYSQRLVERATAVLDGRALARFRESQELALAGIQRQLKEREVMDAARGAARP